MFLVDQRIFLFHTELRAESLRYEFEYESSDPTTNTSTNCDGPVLASKASVTHLHGSAAELNDDYLCGQYTYPDCTEHAIL